VLSRSLAAAGHYPPVDVLDSLSRLMPAVTTKEHRNKVSLARRMLSTHARSEDLVRIGAYKEGTDLDLDRAMRAMPELRKFMEQGSTERVTMDQTIERLVTMDL
jgi:flagellum-specific ATP synthase